MTWLWIAVGSALGGVGRYAAVQAGERLFGAAFPWGTLAVNVAGSFAIVLFAGLVSGDGRFRVPDEVRLFVTVGLLGGFTTFSSFSLQTLDLLRGGEPGRAALYVLGSVALCLLGAWAGHLAAGGIGGLRT
jgi:fluoride exporter